MMRLCRHGSGLLLVLVISLEACSSMSGHPSLSSPFFVPDPRDAKLYQAFAREQDILLATCAESHSCDRAHFTRALVALYENKEIATKHFQEVVDGDPKSRLAASSLLWLRLLQDSPANAGLVSPFARSTERLVRDLLEMETSSVLALQRELQARDKKVEELTQQLEALKRIDQEMKEKERPTKPSNK